MKKAMIAVAAMAVSGAATAGPAWTYVDGGIVFTESTGDTPVGAKLTGSFGFDLFHVNGSYTTISDSIDVTEIEDITDQIDDSDDYDVWRIGAGIHPAITDNTDMFLEIGYSSGEGDNSDVEPDGIDFTAGVRSMITDNFELGAAAVLVIGDADFCGPGSTDNCDDDVQDTGLRVFGQYFFTDNFSLNVTATQGVSIETGNIGGGDSFQVGGRWSF